MARREPRARADGPPRACCLVSEVLEEAGLDRKKARELRRQLLEGLVLFCRWQLERLNEVERAAEAAPRPRRQARKVRLD